MGNLPGPGSDAAVSRLSTAAADIDQALRAASREAALRSADMAAVHALESVGLRDLSVNSLADLDKMAESFDEQYFSIKEKAEGENRSLTSEEEAASEAAFSKARALMACAYTKRGQADEAIYEALIATEHSPELRDRVMKQLRSAGGR